MTDDRARYDEHTSFYLDFVDRNLGLEGGLLQVLLATFDELLGPRLDGARVLDVACGEGYVSRHLAGRAASVAGIDISESLIEAARRRTEQTNVEFRVDDAHLLATLTDESCDIAVSQMAFMDIADHRSAFAAVRRVLADEGVFAFSVLHPALEGAPFHEPDDPKFLFDEDGTRVAYRVSQYAAEGFFMSGGQGVRGRVGSYHRTISTYVADLLGAGFVLDAIREPVVPGEGLPARVPQTMVFAAHKKPDRTTKVRSGSSAPPDFS